MRPFARIVLALAMGLASEMVFAQEPAPSRSGESAAPVTTPIADDGAPETLTAPADAMPSTDAAPEVPGDLSAFAALVATAQTPTPGPPETPAARVEGRVELPPPVPGVGVELGSVEDADLGRTGGARDWFFVGVLALAIAVIALKLLRTKSERISIHEERRLGGLS